MKKLKVFSFADRNPEFLQLQIDSFNKHIKSENSEFIVVNASQNHFSQIKDICENNNIEMINYTGGYDGFPKYYVKQLNWFRDNFQKEINDYIMFIHADMFFINSFDYESLMSNYKIVYNPQYRNKFCGYSGEIKYMWDGVLLIDSEYFNKNNSTSLINWDTYDGITDVGGKNDQYISEVLKRNIHNYFEFWNLGEVNNEIYDTHLNGNVRYFLNTETRTFDKTPTMITRSFDYELEREDYIEYYIKKFEKIKETFLDPYDFEKPINFDVIQVFEENVEKSFLFHFKSASWFNYNESHKYQKMKEIEKIVKREIV